MLTVFIILFNIPARNWRNDAHLVQTMLTHSVCCIMKFNQKKKKKNPVVINHKESIYTCGYLITYLQC